MISATGNRIDDVRPSWIGSPLIVQPRRRSRGVELVGGDDEGPTGQKPGIDLPSSHWSPSSHESRDETSLTIV